GPGPTPLGDERDLVAVLGEPGLDGVGDGRPLVGAERDAHGSRLRVARRPSHRRAPSATESSNERKVPFYERHGFEVVADYRCGGDGPVMTMMSRRPR